MEVVWFTTRAMRLSPRVLSTGLATALCATAIAGCGGGGGGGLDRKANDAGAGVVKAFAEALVSCDQDRWKNDLVPLLVSDATSDFDTSAASIADCKKQAPKLVETLRDGVDDDNNPVWEIKVTTSADGPTSDTVSAVRTGDGWAVKPSSDDPSS